MNSNIGRKAYLPFVIPSTELLAGTAIDLVAPFDGFIEELQTIVQTAVTTGGTITAKIGTTDVAGLQITIADAATKGTVQTDEPTAPSATRRFSKGDRIQIVPSAGFATAGAVNGNLIVRQNATVSA
jgi:hypothetical protein